MLNRGKKRRNVAVRQLLDAWVFVASGSLIASFVTLFLDIFSYLQSGAWVPINCGWILPPAVVPRLHDSSLCLVLLVVSLILLLIERFLAAPLLANRPSR